MTISHETSRSSVLERALAFAAVSVPIATAVIAELYASASARRDAGVRLTELAIGILGQPVSQETKALRGWAVEVVNQYSDVELPKELGRALTDSLSLPAGQSLSWGTPNGGIRIDSIIGQTAELTALKPGRWPLVVCAAAARYKQCDTSWVVIPGTPLRPSKHDRLSENCPRLSPNYPQNAGSRARRPA